jgi:uncharacterized protein YndB with AHSA1/START domain
MWGRLSASGGIKALRFERDYAVPVAKLWAALTTPERIGDWLCADAQIELRQGGRFHLAFRNFAHSITGEITRIEPPYLLEYTWPEQEANGNSLVRWELSATKSGCHLVLTHSLTKGGDAADFASGWHYHLDALGPAAAGVATAWSEQAWRTLQSAYRARFTAA